MSVQKVCGHCAKPFLVPPRRSETVKFCSIECKTAGRRVTLTCAACGESFGRPKHLAHVKYCSNECAYSARKGIQHADRIEPRYHTCEVCAVPFRITLTRKDTARFCSRVCQGKSPTHRKHLSDRQRGEKHWRWAGGRYEGKYGYVRVKGHDLASGEFHFEHRRVVEKAMLEMEPNHPFLVEIDDRKKLSREIEVHHIDRDRSNNALSNLLAVTKDAHAQIHHRNRKPEPWECWPYSNLSDDPSAKH